MSQFGYDFIQQLTMREKAYFKRYTRLSGDKADKNYLLLYDELSKMKQYKIQELRTIFKDHSIGKSLASELNYLTNLLLKSMVNFHFDSSAESQLQRTILCIYLLIEKGFRKQALKILKKAKRNAHKHELFTFSLQLIQLEEEILFKQGILGFTKKLENLATERLQLHEQIKNLNQLRLLREQIREFWLTYRHVDQKDIIQYPHLFDNPILSSRDQALSLRGLEHWLYIKSGQSYVLAEFDNFQLYEKEKIDLLELHPHLFNKELLGVALANYMYSSAFLKDHPSFDEAIFKLKQLESDKSLNQIFISFIKYSRTLEFYYQFDKHIYREKFLTEAERYLNSHIDQLQVTQIDYMYFLIARAYLTYGFFQKSLDLLNNWQQRSIIDVLLPHARLLSLIVYLELGLLKRIESEIETAYKILKRRGKYNLLVKILLSFFRLHLRSPKNSSKQYLKIKSQLDSISSSNRDIITIQEDFDYIEWLNQKIDFALSTN